MNTMAAFAMGMANRGKQLKCFDWNRAAQLIREHKPSEAVAGLSGDMEYTSGSIYRDGKIIAEEDTYVYLASTWSTPVLILDGEEHDCYIMEDDYPKEWGAPSKAYWPESARKILLG